MTDYMQIAADSARRAFAKPVTHWLDTNASRHRGEHQAACGQWVRDGEVSTDPTCPVCAAEQAHVEAMEF